jgi:transglutaminase-like putative cysteine protease
MKSQQIKLPNLITWISHQIGTTTGLSLALLLVCLSSVAYGMTPVVRGLSLGLGLGLAYTGLGVGWLLGRSKLQAGWSAGIATLLGATSLLTHLGDLLGNAHAILQSLNQLGSQLVRTPLDGYRHLAQFKALLASWGELWDKLSVLLVRVSTFLVGQVTGNPGYDPLVAVLLWSMGLWAVAVWAAWEVRRQARPLVAVTPAGILLAAVLGYSRADTSTLLPLLGSALLLIVLVQHKSRQKRWDAEGTDYYEGLSLDIATVAVPMAVMIVSLAAFAPNISPRRISQVVQESLRIHIGDVEDLGESLGLQRQTLDSPLYDDWLSPGMPHSQLIGSGPELSREMVMEIQPTQFQIPAGDFDAALLKTTRPSYWRSWTYDVYTGYGWRTSKPELIAYKAGELAHPPGFPKDETDPAVWQSHISVIQEIEIFENAKGLLYVAGAILTTDQDYQIAWRQATPSTRPDIFGGSISKAHYRVQSLISNPNEHQLRATDSEYPPEIRTHYLSLPASVPQRVQALALQLTAVQPTPYDRALAIESYLRNYPYSLNVPLPPPNVDVVAYFLFDLKRGYCDYYATAMVVLARAAGIPARLVTGYAGGTYDIDRGITAVTEADAHSWAELYFPGIGWVEFEPTNGRPGLSSPIEGLPPSLALAEEKPFPTPYSQQEAWIWLIGLSILPGILLVCFFVWQLLDDWHLKDLSPSSVVIILYQRLYLQGNLIITNQVTGETPYEFATKFSSAMESLEVNNKWGKRLAVSRAQVDRLTRLYNWAAYSPHPVSQADQMTAVQVWKQIRWRLRLLRFFLRLVRRLNSLRGLPGNNAVWVEG